MSRIVRVVLIVAVIYCVSNAEAENSVGNCKANEEWNSCGTACEPSCENPNPKICTFNCVIGCQCKSGFLRDSSRACVRPKDCTSD